MSEEPEELTADKARKLLDTERRRRERDCMVAIEAALTEHRCRIHFREIRVDGQLVNSTLIPEALE